ncbi:chlorophyll A-B binding protein [Aureococcus anophagefferens]|nr:chlorophyll A-B binding protein [Aureococcus anophagefferens]
MKSAILALAISGASAYVAPQTKVSGSALAATKDEVVALAEANPDFLGQAIGFWDPLGALDTNFWGLGNEGTIGYLRHAEIKHGRVAMAAFLGYLAGSTELWDAIPLYGKLQIIVLVGMLESYGEILDPHYTNGGLPGYYPPIKGKRPELVFNLFDPFGFFEQDSPEKKARGRLAEINNGRLAMLGIFSILSEAGAPGSVPALQGLIPAYDGNVMIPFSGDFSIFS